MYTELTQYKLLQSATEQWMAQLQNCDDLWFLLAAKLIDILAITQPPSQILSIMILIMCVVILFQCI